MSDVSEQFTRIPSIARGGPSLFACIHCGAAVGYRYLEEHLAWHADIEDAVVAVQRTLGLNPQGHHITVVERLNQIETVLNLRKESTASLAGEES